MYSKFIINAAYLAWADTKARYKKSVLGPFWIVLTNIIGIFGLSLIWSKLLGQDFSVFAPTLAIGLIVWQLIAGVLGEAPGVFVRESRMIRNVSLPIWFFVIRLLAKHVITFAHNLVLVAGVIWYFELPLTITSALAMVALPIIIANLFFLTCLLGIFGARFRDVELAINAALPLLFFISPVMFRVENLPLGDKLIWFNPLSYFIESVRAPLLGISTNDHTLMVLVFMLLVIGPLAWFVMRRYGSRLAFWV